ncbi:MAG: porphobilinogen synthase [Acidobacteriota bacterium]
MGFPRTRLRRLRRSEKLRELVRETELRATDLVSPLFVCPGENVRRPIPSMPGHHQLSIDCLVEECQQTAALGVPAVILFGIPSRKDERGSEAYDPEGIVQGAVQAVKKAAPELLVITDVCLCEYTSHGHCGLVRGKEILNDPTLELLSRQAVSHVRAGANVVAPSDMMDGRVGAIRRALDEAGFENTPILSYAAKYASGFYGPFRDAAESTPQFGDRRSHQMDPSNAQEALREVRLDLEEGADIVMVKPALPYLDVVYRVKQTFGVPVAAYQVSGEFALIKAAAAKGWIDEERVVMESLIAIKRAGADFILSYFAKDVARQLKQG